jgi:uroporphyrinogen decarboxylase
VGPVVENPIESPSDIDRLRPFDARDELAHILEQIRLLTPRLEVPVIGFVGAPLTLCSYLIRGPRSRNLEETKAFLWTEPAAADRLLAFWAEQLAGFAVAQHEAGAAAIQVFDSWAGALEPDLYAARVLPHSRALLDHLREAGVPSIHFSTGNPRLLPLVAAAGGDALGVDWRLPIDEAWAVAGPDRAVQGNLDPAALLAGEEVARERTRDVMERVARRPGHVFNLGHGMLPGTDPQVARAVVDEVHAFEPGPLAADPAPEP